jgi:hypothetical protein
MAHGMNINLTGDPLLDSLKKFAANLRLKTPIPMDIIPLLTRDPQKQLMMVSETTAATLFKPLPAFAYRSNDPRFQKPSQYTYPADPVAADDMPSEPVVHQRVAMSAQFSRSPSHYHDTKTSFQAPYYNIATLPPIPGRSRHQVWSNGHWTDFMAGPQHINPPPPAPRFQEVDSIPAHEFAAAEADEPHPNYPDIKKSSPAIQHLLQKDPYPRFDDVPGFIVALEAVTRPLVRCVPEPGVVVHHNLEAILWETESALRRAFLHKRDVTVAEAIMRLECCRELAARVSAGEWDEKC